MRVNKVGLKVGVLKNLNLAITLKLSVLVNLHHNRELFTGFERMCAALVYDLILIWKIIRTEELHSKKRDDYIDGVAIHIIILSFLSSYHCLIHFIEHTSLSYYNIVTMMARLRVIFVYT